MAEYSLWDVLRYRLVQSVSHCRRERELNISSPATVCQEDRNSSYTDILRKLFLILPCPSLLSPTKQKESFMDLPPPHKHSHSKKQPQMLVWLPAFPTTTPSQQQSKDERGFFEACISLSFNSHTAPVLQQDLPTLT